MNEVAFKNWLIGRDLNPKVRSDIVSRIKKVEKEIENCDIDEQYRSDRCEALMSLFLNMGLNEEMKKTSKCQISHWQVPYEYLPARN